MTQARLAELAGIDRTSIAHVEHGDHLLSLAGAKNIADVLGVPMDELVRFADVAHGHGTPAGAA